MKDEKLYLIHIQESMARIREYTAGGKQKFLADRMVQDAVIRNLETLAEAVGHLSSRIKAAHPEIDWVGIAGFRNVLAHDYLGIILARVWQVIEDDLPPLEQTIEKILIQLDKA